MATRPLGEANKQWDEALTNLLNLSKATVQHNAELEAKVTDLEVELSVWKHAHAVALESAEREAKTHNVHLASLNRQISSLETFRDQSPLILCVVDGNKSVFSPYLFKQGQQGGREAAQQLTKAIAEYLSSEEVQVFGRLSFWITVYLDKKGLLDMLLRHDICTQDQFESFFSGFSLQSPRFLLVDVGYGREGTESKIREYLHTYTRFQQTLRVFFTGAADVTYKSTLSSLEKDHYLGKLVWVRRREDMVEELQGTPLIPTLSIPDLFMDPSHLSVSLKTPPSRTSDISASPSAGRLTSPRSFIAGPSNNYNGGGRLIDPSLPLHKQLPPPCNEHYLMTCTKGSACKYSHDYQLTPEQLTTLAVNAKKAPCNFLKNGLPCPYGDRCCWGHVCPNGHKCFHLSKGKCWFKGESMHPRLEESPSRAG